MLADDQHGIDWRRSVFFCSQETGVLPAAKSVVGCSWQQATQQTYRLAGCKVAGAGDTGLSQVVPVTDVRKRVTGLRLGRPPS